MPSSRRSARRPASGASADGRAPTLFAPCEPSTRRTLTRAADSAGHKPGRTPAIRISSPMNITTFAIRRQVDVLRLLDRDRERCSISDWVHVASTSASAPDIAAIRKPSVTTSRIRRAGLAPSAVRMPMSRSRSTARASSRLVTLKQARSSTSPMMPIADRRPQSATPRRSPFGWPIFQNWCRMTLVRVGPVTRHRSHGGVELPLNLGHRHTGIRPRHDE